MSNSGPVARWLETFFCKQYADVFEKFGYTTLQQVCSLNTTNLLSMGVTIIDCEKIMDNVSVLKQTLQQAGTSINYNQYDPLTSIPAIQEPVVVTNTKQHKKSKAKANDKSNNKSNNDNYATTTASPNITVKPTTNQVQQNRYLTKANPEMAKQIANDILTITKNTNLNTKYTCIPLNQSQYQNQQFLSGSSNNNQYWSNNVNNNQKQQNDSLNNPLKSLERLVALPETQVIDPKSVVNDNNDIIVNYDYNINDINSQYQQQYKPNSLKRMDNSINNDFNDDIYNTNKKFCSQPINMNQSPPQQQQQQYYYNQNNYYLQQPNNNNNNTNLCNDQQQQQQQQQLNEYYYQNNENNNYEQINQNYDYYQQEQLIQPPVQQQQPQPQDQYFYSNNNNQQLNQPPQYQLPQQQQQQQQYYSQYQQQQQQFDINTELYQ